MLHPYPRAVSEGLAVFLVGFFIHQAGNVAGIWQSGQQIAAVPAFWLALFAYGLSVVVWLVGLSRVPVSQAYPILSLGYVLTALLAWPLLGEIVSGQRVLGIFVIIAGVWLITRS